MRLAIVTPFLETYGGVEKVVLRIAQHFDAKVYTASYNAISTYAEFSDIDVEVIGSALGKLPLGKRLASAINAGKAFYDLKLDDYDVVNAHQSPSEFARNNNAPMLLYCHSPNREAFDLYEWRMKHRSIVQKALFWTAIKAFRHLEFSVVPKIDYIFTNSRNSQTRIRHYLHRDSEVLYPGIDYKGFHCNGYEKFLFYPSRIVPEKEMEFAINAFKQFAARHKDGRGKGWRLVIAGAVSERPEHKAYLEKLRAMADERISIMANISDKKLKELYAHCFAVLYTPINEDLGLIPLEAMASSKPCIARNQGGPRETILHGRDGYLVDSEDAMARCIGQLAKRPELAEELGKAGRAKVIKKFTWKQFLKRFGEKARELAKER